MKRLRLWVKVVLMIMAIGMLVGCTKMLNDYTKKTIQSCVEGGHTYEWCARELKK